VVYIDPYFDPKITLGSILVAGSMIVAASTSAATALLAWRDLNWRIKNAEKWQADHDKRAEQNDQILQELKDIVVRLDESMRSTTQRLQTVENVAFRRRGGG
jgi:hypothetical protein